jgi:hypothetical protein
MRITMEPTTSGEQRDRAMLRTTLLAAATALSVLAFAPAPAEAAEAVSDAAAQQIARRILEDYKAERKLNVPRWADLAHDEGTGKQVDCPVSAFGGPSQPVSYKDCNLAYFQLKDDRFTEILQSWAVLDAKQKADVAAQFAPLFATLSQNPAVSVSGQTVAQAYGGGAPGLNQLLSLLGIQTEAGSDDLIKTVLDPTFAKGTKILDNLLAAHTQVDVDGLIQMATAAQSDFKNLGPDHIKGLGDRLKETKYIVDSQKNQLAESAHVAGKSKTRADAVRDLTTKIAALGSSGADQSLVSAKLAQYEFYLAALDALAREEQIKSAAHRQGERAQTRLIEASYEARRMSGAVERATAK